MMDCWVQSETSSNLRRSREPVGYVGKRRHVLI